MDNQSIIDDADVLLLQGEPLGLLEYYTFDILQL